MLASGRSNARVVLGTVTRIDVHERTVHARTRSDRETRRHGIRHPASSRPVPGSPTSGNDDFATYAPGHEVDRRRARAARADLHRVRAGRGRRPPPRPSAPRSRPSSSSAPGRPAWRWPGRSAEMAHRTLRKEFRRSTRATRGSSSSTPRRPCCRASANASVGPPSAAWRRWASTSDPARWSPTSTRPASRCVRPTAPPPASRP
jgi:hypothetical protein